MYLCSYHIAKKKLYFESYHLKFMILKLLAFTYFIVLHHMRCLKLLGYICLLYKECLKYVIQTLLISFYLYIRYLFSTKGVQLDTLSSSATKLILVDFQLKTFATIFH